MKSVVRIHVRTIQLLQSETTPLAAILPELTAWKAHARTADRNKKCAGGKIKNGGEQNDENDQKFLNRKRSCQVSMHL